MNNNQENSAVSLFTHATGGSYMASPAAEGWSFLNLEGGQSYLHHHLRILGFGPQNAS